MDESESTVREALPGNTVSAGNRLGTHLLADLYGVRTIQHEGEVRLLLSQAAVAAETKVLNIAVHAFEESAGITAIALLSESHLSIHTWPEYGFAAIDMFTCGTGDPLRALDVFTKAFNPDRSVISRHDRGARLDGVTHHEQ